jgi:small subunit ribosomal protein S21
LVKIVLRERESVQEAVRRFRKLVERTGLKREMRRREHYEKPSDVKRRAKARAIRKSQTNAHARSGQPPTRFTR